MWVDLFQSFQQQVSCDMTTQLLHTNTVSSTGGISAALNTVQRLQFTLDTRTQAPSLELMHEMFKLGGMVASFPDSGLGNFNTGIRHGTCNYMYAVVYPIQLLGSGGLITQ